MSSKTGVLPLQSTGSNVVEAQGVGKKFDIYLNDRSRFFEFFGRRKHHEEHWALRNVSFQVRRGRSFGIVGANGAGKSTLLKLIARISRPTEGLLKVNESMSTLLDLGLGFHRNFTGRENITLNCSLLGMSREKMEARIPHIVEFAELAAFIDYPVRTYSTGMLLRLGFSIAAHSDAEVFLVDEVLAVGDQYFQRKCIRKIEEFVDRGRTIILVSHDLHAVRSLCHEVLWLHAGETQAVGPARDVVDRYLGQERVRVAINENTGNRPLPFQPSTSPPPPPQSYEATVDDPQLKSTIMEACAIADPRGTWNESLQARPYDQYDGDKPIIVGSGEVRVLEVRIMDNLGRPRHRFRTGDTMVVAVTFRTTEPVERPIFGVALFRDDGTYVYGPNTRYDGVLDRTYHGIFTYFIVYPRLPLLAGTFRISIAVFDSSHLKPHVWHNQLYEIELLQDVEDHGLVRLPHAWGMITHLNAEDEAPEE